MPRALPTLPKPEAEFTDKTARPTQDWLKFFLDLVAALKNRLPVTGSVTFAAATTAAVTFTTAEADANYDVWLGSFGEDNFGWVTSRTTAGFTANAKNSTSATVRYQLIRA